ncbi:MAG: PLP-dependent aminotransferase family protein [Ruminococcaceae bacterium]|nr:PLP-dependent aminotransferase family protein [Oscillospiraceae bacterium]
MNFNINTDLHEPAYMQLYVQIRSGITSGALRKGDKLPSKRTLAEETGVSVITVEHAYAILADEGYIESRQRSGYYVTYREKDFISVLANDNDIKDVDFSSHHPSKNTFPFSVMAKTMRRVLSEYGESILLKSPNRGTKELREAISAYLFRSNGIRVGSEQVVIGSGAEYLYSLIVQLLGRDKIYALESPSYDKILKVYSAMGVECDMLKLSRNGIGTSELEKTSAKILHITPFNSYPSHITADISKRNEYIHWARQREGFIVEDNYDSELSILSKPEDTVFSLDPNRVIYLNTFSQTIAPSIRVGYMILPESLIGQFQERLGFYSCTVPVFEQYVLSELINGRDFERHINRVRRQLRNKN